MKKLSKSEIERLQLISQQNRIVALRMIYGAESGHPGGTLSCADIITYLYECELRIYPEDHQRKDRDRFVLSKGHACPVLYAELARRGFFSAEHLESLRRPGSICQGVPDKRLTPGVDMTTGSLGIGFSSAVGMAMAAYLRKSPARVYCIIGDGEITEGMIWEGMLFAAHHSLNNLTCFLDHNRFGSDALMSDTLNVEPYTDKLKAFGWDVYEVDGHDFQQICWALDEARSRSRPVFIIARTVKGKGVPYMENDPMWHGSLKLSKEQLDEAIAALSLENHCDAFS